MNIAMPAWTIGSVIALVVLIICIVLAVLGEGPSGITLALIGALAVARLT